MKSIFKSDVVVSIITLIVCDIVAMLSYFCCFSSSAVSHRLVLPGLLIFRPRRPSHDLQSTALVAPRRITSTASSARLNPWLSAPTTLHAARIRPQSTYHWTTELLQAAGGHGGGWSLPDPALLPSARQRPRCQRHPVLRQPAPPVDGPCRTQLSTTPRTDCEH